MKSTGEIFDFIKASLSLFKAVPNLKSKKYAQNSTCELDNESNVAHGFFITERAFQACPYVADREIHSFLKNKFGYDIFELNQSFYKSFATVANSTPLQLFINQILHYLTTYGAERLGIFDRNSVYIPNDVLNLPENSKPVKITVIDLIDNAEIKARTLKMIRAGVALSEETINDLFTIINFLNVKLNVAEIKNKEFAMKYYEQTGSFPDNPTQFLRYMIYIATDSTLLIKNGLTIHKIKNSQIPNLPLLLHSHFAMYIAKNGIDKLASIFHRFKPLWLAFKRHSNYMKSTINKMRKLADRYHKPVKPQLLEHLTSAENVNLDELKAELAKVTTFKKISIANALLYRNAAPKSIVYYIRNGKAFAEEFHGNLKFKSQEILEVVIDSIAADIRPNVQGKKICIPASFNYAVPVSEKKFLGNIPYGSSYNFTGKSCVVGVHWFNLLDKYDDEVHEVRIDLDLHFNSRDINVGWNSYYKRSKELEIIFSGDMTDAPISRGGAAEAFFVGEKLTNVMIITNLNYYNCDTASVPFKLFLADVEQVNLDRKYLVGAHELAFCVPNEIKSGEMFLGFLFANETGDKKFYFYPADTGNRRVSRYDNAAAHTLSAMITTFSSFLSLNEVLLKAGAIFEGVTAENCDINLDPLKATKDTLIGLMVSR